MIAAEAANPYSIDILKISERVKSPGDPLGQRPRLPSRRALELFRFHGSQRLKKTPHTHRNATFPLSCSRLTLWDVGTAVTCSLAIGPEF